MKKALKKAVRSVGAAAHSEQTAAIAELELKLREVLALNRILVEKQSNTGIMHVSPHEIVTKIFTGLKIYLDTRDLSVTPHLALDGIYEGHISNAWLSLVEPDSTVFDIGANFGYFGALAAQKTDKKNSRVVCFEANPKLVPYIRKTLAVNWINEQSTVENVAVSSKKGNATLHVFKDYIGSSSLHDAEHIDAFMHEKMYVETIEEVEVPATTIDSYCTDHSIKAIDLIKIDIEGYEEEAYKGMRTIIKKSPNVTMFIEFTKQSYKKPESFYEQMLADFGNVYVIDGLGKLHKPVDSSYAAVIDATDDWVMPVFSKKSDLDRI
jgi:FkbM family methyltransferase